MTLAFDPPPCPDSPLRRLDPRWKLAGLLVAIGCVASLDHLGIAALAFAGALLLAIIGRLPPRWVVMRLAALGTVLALFALPLPFLVKGAGPAWEWAGLHVSQHGVAVAVRLVLKTLTLVTLALVLLCTSPLDANLKAAHSLRIPGLLVQVALLSYRYLFLMLDELRRLRVALRVRGFRPRATGHGYRTVGHVTGTLLVRSYERAERVGQAMRCRGFEGTFRSLTSFRTRAADVLAFAVLVAVSACLVVLDRARL